jgi:hypothetical protein
MEGYFTSAGQGEAGDPDEDAGIVVPIIRTAEIFFFLHGGRPPPSPCRPSRQPRWPMVALRQVSPTRPRTSRSFYPRSKSACIRVRLRPAAPPETPRLAGADGDHALPKLVLTTQHLPVLNQNKQSGHLWKRAKAKRSTGTPTGAISTATAPLARPRLPVHEPRHTGNKPDACTRSGNQQLDAAVAAKRVRRGRVGFGVVSFVASPRSPSPRPHTTLDLNGGR